MHLASLRASLKSNLRCHPPSEVDMRGAIRDSLPPVVKGGLKGAVFISIGFALACSFNLSARERTISQLVAQASAEQPPVRVQPRASTPQQAAANVRAADRAMYGQIVGTTVNLRSGPDTAHDIIGVLRSGADLQITAKQGEWYEIEWPQHVPAWVSKEFVDTKGTVTADRLNIRSNGHMKSKVLLEATKGTQLTILGEAGNWYKVKAPESARAYVFGKFVELKSDASAVANTARQAPSENAVKRSVPESTAQKTVEPETETAGALPSGFERLSNGLLRDPEGYVFEPERMRSHAAIDSSPKERYSSSSNKAEYDRRLRAISAEQEAAQKPIPPKPRVILEEVRTPALREETAALPVQTPNAGPRIELQTTEVVTLGHQNVTAPRSGALSAVRTEQVREERAFPSKVLTSIQQVVPVINRTTTIPAPIPGLATEPDSRGLEQAPRSAAQSNAVPADATPKRNVIPAPLVELSTGKAASQPERAPLLAPEVHEPGKTTTPAVRPEPQDSSMKIRSSELPPPIATLGIENVDQKPDRLPKILDERETNVSQEAVEPLAIEATGVTLKVQPSPTNEDPARKESDVNIESKGLKPQTEATRLEAIAPAVVAQSEPVDKPKTASVLPTVPSEVIAPARKPIEIVEDVSFDPVYGQLLPPPRDVNRSDLILDTSTREVQPQDEASVSFRVGTNDTDNSIKQALLFDLGATPPPATDGAVQVALPNLTDSHIVVNAVTSEVAYRAPARRNTAYAAGAMSVQESILPVPLEAAPKAHRLPQRRVSQMLPLDDRRIGSAEGILELSRLAPLEQLEYCLNEDGIVRFFLWNESSQDLNALQGRRVSVIGIRQEIPGTHQLILRVASVDPLD